jgi:hypothetical protein
MSILISENDEVRRRGRLAFYGAVSISHHSVDSITVSEL